MTGPDATAASTLRVATSGRVRLLTLDRPAARNAIDAAMMAALAAELAAADADPGIHCTVIAGSDTMFAAGADIREMAARTFPDTYLDDLYRDIDRIAASRKPVIAAVAGPAFGGGCELVLAADVVIAADTARFGQPEITLGIIPGLGGTQRLTRAVGKARAMELILTGRIIDAAEAERIGIVSRVVPAAGLMAAAMAVAERMATLPLSALLMAKESIGRSFELPLAEGIRFERRLFQSLFATPGQKEGMAAFLEKRKPDFFGG